MIDVPWFTNSVVKSSVALYAGYELRDATSKKKKDGRKDRVTFEFSQDANLSTLLDSFEKGELLVEPKAFFEAVVQIRQAVHDANDGREFTRRTSIWLDEAKEKYKERPAMKGSK